MTADCYLLENVISTPQVGRSTRQSMPRAAVHTVKNIFYSRDGKEPPARFVVG
jgi:phosphoglycerate dehydrogenase-like enzyme